MAYNGRPPFAALVAFALFSLASAQSVLQYHGNDYKNGFYVDPLFNATNINTIALDASFNVSVPGPVYAQVLYLVNGSRGRDVIFVATEQNQVLALDARTGSTIWNRTLGPPVNGTLLPCGNISPSGITGTPVIDLVTGTIAFVTLTTANGTREGIRSVAWALYIANGTVVPGWPVDIQALITGQNSTFISANQQQRGALALLNSTVYIPYGGLAGDCEEYYGTVVGIPLLNTSAADAYLASPYKGGLWSAPGITTDGSYIYGTTGNTGGLDDFTPPENWSGGEAIIKLSPGPNFSNSSQDFFTPVNWKELDRDDVDIGSSGALLVDLPGSTPLQLVFAMGKNGVVYIGDRNNLGGVGGAVFQAQVAQGAIITTPVAYNTSNGTYIALAGGATVLNGIPGSNGDVIALKLNPGSPPNFTVAWTARAQGGGRSSLIATSPDGNSTAIVWVLGAQGSNTLRGFDGVTGTLVYNGTQVFSRLRQWQTPIVAKGRLYFADDTQLYAFTLAGAPALPIGVNATVANGTTAAAPVAAPPSNTSVSTNASLPTNGR